MTRRATPLLLILIIASSATASSKRRSASPDRCSSTVAPGSLSFPASGGHATVDVTVTGGCSWSPVASDSWINAAPAGNQVSVDVSANSGTSARTGLIHVRGATIVVTQDANTNLVQNPGFDNGLAYWSDLYSGPGSVSVISGAAVITSTKADVHSGYQLSQCVNASGGKRYYAGTRALIPAGQGNGVINFAVYEYWERDCPVMPGYHVKNISVESGPLGTWFDTGVSWSTDPRAQSVLVVIGAGGTDSPPFSAWFDDVYLRP